MISFASIQEASNRIASSIHKTPLLTSSYLNDLAGAQLFFKCENFQKTGSFKARGATNSILKLSEQEKGNGVATHSSGNHGQAMAWAAKQAGVKAWVIMPSNAPQVKKDAVKGYGAEIIECEPTLQARESSLAAIQKEVGAVFIPPYNFENTIEGQATSAFEIYNELEGLDFLLTPVGGGGLLSGSALSTYYMSPETKVIGCEPEMVNDAWQSFKSGELKPSNNAPTIADGLKTSLGDINFGYIKEFVTDILLCTEEEIMKATQLVWERMKIIIEPSSAVSLACVLNNRDLFNKKKVAMIVSGGNVDLKSLTF